MDKKILVTINFMEIIKLGLKDLKQEREMTVLFSTQSIWVLSKFQLLHTKM